MMDPQQPQDPAMEQNYTQAAPTQDVGMATGTNTIPNAQPATAFNATDLIPGYGVVKDIGGAVADQANQQSFGTTSGMQAGGIDPVKSADYVGTYKTLRQTNDATDAAALAAAAYQKKYGTAPPMQGAQAEQAIMGQQKQRDVQNKQALADYSQHAALAQNSMNAAIAEAKTDPRSEAWKQLNIDHPVATTISLILGGFAGGGQNSAINMFNARMEGAVQKRADTIKQNYEQSLQERGIAQDALNNLDKSILSQSTSSMMTLNAANGFVDMTQKQVNSATADLAAQQIINGNRQKLLLSQGQLVDWTKQQYNQGNTDKLNAAGLLLNNATGVFQRKPLGPQQSQPQQPAAPMQPAAPAAPMAQPVSTKSKNPLLDLFGIHGKNNPVPPMNQGAVAPVKKPKTLYDALSNKSPEKKVT